MADLNRIRARLLAVEENMRIHAFGCLGEVMKTTDLRFYCHGCENYVPEFETVHPKDRNRPDWYEEDVRELLEHHDQTEES